MNQHYVWGLIESEIRIYTHDIVKANHDKDFRSLAVFPLSELKDCKLVVVRADYKGDVVVETVTGTMWQPGGWIVWTLIWRGHMLLLQPPESLDAEVFLDRWQPRDTALGFLFFWHSRHDQERTAPGPVACRLCRGQKAGEAEFALCRRNSNLAAAAIVGCIRAGAEPSGPSFKVRGRVLCFQEVFAGSAVLSKAFEAAGVKVIEPIEVFEDPHRRQGYREAFDLTLPQVQKDLIYAAGRGPANIWWIASPCTSFCDWGLQNGGTRTFECPARGAGGADLKPTELEGNLLSKVGAEVFLKALESGAFPIAESTASSGWWKEILARPDVAFVEFPMCAFGLGPMDEDGFYHHRTRLVFPRNEAVVAAFSSAAHRHVVLKGARPGQKVTRCTEAGVYAKDFVRTVVEVLQRVVQVGGEGDEANPPHRHRWCRGRPGRWSGPSARPVS